jgi:hypothetical protein
MVELITLASFAVITGLCGSLVARLVKIDREFIVVGSVVGIVVGIAEYFVWKNSLRPSQKP